ncbi:type IV secretory pathway TraG/TraD family ATPase VirD4 [Bradyrhizobium sp. LM6.10]
MSATKIIWHQVILVCLIVLAFLWAATEWTAWRLAFQQQLGTPWFKLGHWPIYQPAAFFGWWFKFDAYAPMIFLEGGRYCCKRRHRGHSTRDVALGPAGR